jgi:hypothetical protein
VIPISGKMLWGIARMAGITIYGVIPAKAGIQNHRRCDIETTSALSVSMDPGFRRDDTEIVQAVCLI